MDKTFLITIPFCLICLLIYWAYISFKEKIIALKTFRDKEMIRIVNHFNAQIKGFEDRITAIDKQTNESESPNESKNRIESKKKQDAEIKEYNKEFLK